MLLFIGWIFWSICLKCDYFPLVHVTQSNYVCMCSSCVCVHITPCKATTCLKSLLLCSNQLLVLLVQSLLGSWSYMQLILSCVLLSRKKLLLFIILSKGTFWFTWHCNSLKSQAAKTANGIKNNGNEKLQLCSKKKMGISSDISNSHSTIFLKGESVVIQVWGAKCLQVDVHIKPPGSLAHVRFVFHYKGKSRKVSCLRTIIPLDDMF